MARPEGCFGCRWLVAQRRVGPHGVVMLSPVFVDDFRLLEHIEDFAVEQFVMELRVEAFAITVFPGTARHDVGGFGPDCCDPLPECLGDELRA